VLVLTFPVPREVESEPPESDPDGTPTIIPDDPELMGLEGGIDDAPTEPPEDFPTEPPAAETSPVARDAPTKPPEEPTTLVPPAEPDAATKQGPSS